MLVTTTTTTTAATTYAGSLGPRKKGGERDAPQSVSFAAHVAAVCGFALAYAAMMTHFLGMLEKKTRINASGRRDSHHSSPMVGSTSSGMVYDHTFSTHCLS
jgi:hypothetical protein